MHDSKLLLYFVKPVLFTVCLKYTVYNNGWLTERSNYRGIHDCLTVVSRLTASIPVNIIIIADASAINALCIRRVTATTRAYNETRGDT